MSAKRKTTNPAPRGDDIVWRDATSAHLERLNAHTFWLRVDTSNGRTFRLQLIADAPIDIVRGEPWGDEHEVIS